MGISTPMNGSNYTWGGDLGYGLAGLIIRVLRDIKSFMSKLISAATQAESVWHATVTTCAAHDSALNEKNIEINVSAES